MANDTVLSILKAVSVLKCFTPAEPRLSIAEIAREVGIPKTTARRLVTTLATSGLLEQTERTGKYTVGPVLYALGILYLTTQNLFAAAKPVFKLLNDLTTEVVSMSILDRGNVVFVMREEAKHPIRLSQHIGTTFPAYSSAMGRTLLSELTDAEIDKLYPDEKLRPVTSKTIATKTELKLKLEQIRKTGLAFDSEGSYEGYEGIAALIRDFNGKAAAAMSFSVPVFRMNEPRREQFATLIKMGASLISYRLGYRDTDNPVHDIQEIHSWWEQNQLASNLEVKNLSNL
jgi:IclR family acetate operon transcriptional repressor